MPNLVLAVPRLDVPEPDLAGSEVDEATWSAMIDTLRPRMLTLSPRELCDLCREAYFTDLLSLIISTPYSDAMRELLKTGISEAVYELLIKDCEKYGPGQLGADLACGAFKRLDALLEQRLAKSASPEQLQQLNHLARQLARLEEGVFNIVLENLGGGYLDHLMKVSGGLEGDLAKRSQQHFEVKTWAYFAQKHQDWRDEPISQEQAAEVITELPIILTGQD